MRTSKALPGFSLKLLALALFAAFGQAHAEDEDIAALTRPDSSVAVGVAGLSGSSSERSFFGQYNGLRRNEIGRAHV